MPDVDKGTRALVNRIYHDFNARDIDAVLANLSDDVQWPNGWEGGYVRGHDEIRDYWTRQWSEIDPTVEPVDVAIEPDGRIDVTVHQVVRDRAGTLLAEVTLHHVYEMKRDQFTRMEIRE
jgi:hypothetical protein